MLLLSTRYGYDGDEMYFVVAGGHPSWGYVDQSALVPLLAKGIDLLFPGNLLALRAPSAQATAAGVVLAGLTARELGGRPRAQLLAGAAFAVAPFVLWTGHLLATTTFDTALWAAITYLVTRWARTRQDRLLLAAGLCTALALQVEYLVPILWVALGVAALCTGRSDLLRRPMLSAGAAITFATALPGLLWQHANGWPYVAMLDAVSAEQEVFQGGRLGFVPWFALYVGPLVGLLPDVPQAVAERTPALVANPLLSSQVGRPEFTEQIGEVHRSLPAEQQARTVVLADVYPHASAPAFHEPAHGLPRVYSGHRGFWFFGPPPDDPPRRSSSAATSGSSVSASAPCGPSGASDHSALENVVLRTPVLWLVSDPVRPWSRSWPEWLHMNIDVNQ